MARGSNNARLGTIKSMAAFETGSRKAMARLAKRVGTDLNKTATKVAQSAGFRNLTDAADAWMADPSQERVLFRDFLQKKIAERTPGGVIPNFLTTENYGQHDEKGKPSNLTLAERQMLSASEGAVGSTVSRTHSVGGKVVGQEVIPKFLDEHIRSLGYRHLLQAVMGEYDKSRAAGKKEVSYGTIVGKLFDDALNKPIR